MIPKDGQDSLLKELSNDAGEPNNVRESKKITIDFDALNLMGFLESYRAHQLNQQFTAIPPLPHI